jgi:hypothetical protein
LPLRDHRRCVCCSHFGPCNLPSCQSFNLLYLRRWRVAEAILTAAPRPENPAACSGAIGIVDTQFGRPASTHTPGVQLSSSMVETPAIRLFETAPMSSRELPRRTSYAWSRSRPCAGIWSRTGHPRPGFRQPPDFKSLGSGVIARARSTAGEEVAVVCLLLLLLAAISVGQTQTHLHV